MSDQRDNGIAWTDETWNPLRGCSKVSAGCKHCYAETMAARFAKPGQPYYSTIANGRWNGNIRLVPEKLAEPLRWRRPRRIFVNSMSDLFHEGVPFEYIAAVFGVMAACPHHTFQVLTKRPERAVKFFDWLHGASAGGSRISALLMAAQDVGLSIHLPLVYWPLPNVWLGVSVEDQATADARIPLMLQCPAAVRWVSYEPALGPVDFAALGYRGHRLNAMDRTAGGRLNAVTIDWIVVGGESGSKARSFDPAWASNVIGQCRKFGVAPFVKQLGARPILSDEEPPFVDKAAADPAEWPESLRVREWPSSTTN